VGQSLIALKNDILMAGKRVYERGYVASNDGNISARIDNDRVLITPTGVSKGYMKPEDLTIVDFNGKVISGTKKPSSEVFMHLQVYKDRPDVNSVCHAHPPYATGFAVAGMPLDKCVLPEVIIVLGSVPLVEYGTPGTEEFYKPVLKFLKDHDAFLLANHGALTIGKDVMNAYHKMETIEHFAKIAFIAQQLGFVNTLNKEQVSKLTDLRKKFGIKSDIGCISCEANSCPSNLTQTEKGSSDEELIKKITAEVIKQLR
jgi:L-fuculose-phosphate aldolase